MHNLTIAELIRGLQSKEFSSVELTQHFLARIAKLDPNYNAVITVTADQALQAAATADQRLATGNASACLLYTSPSPRDRQKSRMPSSA